MSKHLVRVATLAIAASGILLMGANANATAQAPRSGGDVIPAKAGTDVPQRLVQFHDADLNRSADVTTVYSQLRLAARSVCAEIQPSRDVRLERLRRECFRNALSDAVAKVNSPKLTALHEARVDIKLAARKGALQPQS